MNRVQGENSNVVRFCGLTAKRRVLTTVSAIALVAAVCSVGNRPALAQEDQQEAQALRLEEIVVTGTRVIRDGYEAPTPLAVLSTADILALAPTNIADAINRMPTLLAQNTPQTARQSVTSGGGGLNSLNLRTLGPTRTLTLLDGRRSVAAMPTGVVDVNSFPQGLISRVDVVTGGASSVYGSDALAGVVNMVLDTNFTGIKGDVQGGVTTYGDNRNFKVTLTGGTPFANDRGHFLLAGEVSHVAGVLDYPREWARQGWRIINNPNYTPTNGEPERLWIDRAVSSNQTPGGIITAGPLRGIAFGPDGTPFQFQYGPLTRDPWTAGSRDYRDNDVTDVSVSMNPRLNRRTVYTRLSYDVTDNINVFTELSWVYTFTNAIAAANFNQGNLTIQGDNAFIPDEIRTQMTALGLTSLRMGTMSGDLPFITSGPVSRNTNRYVIGAEGTFEAMDSEWNWDIYYQKGKTRRSYTFTDKVRDNYSRAIDAVRDPATGNIVCRSTLLGETGSEGCVPFNIFGIGVNNPAAIAYSSHGFYNYENYTQDVIAASAVGEPLSTWAGPVSLAFGVEHRKEGGDGIQDDFAAANRALVGNAAPTFGSYKVTEGFLETVVPLADEEPWADALDVNAAVRFTDYSVTGYVTTWKVGATYSPIPDLTIRATRSRDIRSANRQELFAAGRFVGNTFLDPFRDESVNINTLTTGNTSLKPEKADTTGIGVIVQPSWLPGVSASVDYYDINIKDAIGQVNGRTVLERCFAGQQVFCNAVDRLPPAPGETIGQLSLIRVQPTNFISLKARGMDFEMSYQTAVDSLVSGWDGDLTLRALITHFIANKTDDGSGLVIDTVGQNYGVFSGSGVPNWRYLLTASYDNDPFRITVTGRGVSAGTYNNNFIGCTSGCPTSTGVNRTININRIAGALYLDAAFSYKVTSSDEKGVDTEMYLTIDNVFNKDPAVAPNGPGSVAFSTAPASPALYDIMGRQFRAGFRFRM